MNTKRFTAALGAAVLVILGSATSAFATFDTSYEAPSVDLQLNPTEVVGGNSFTATATSNQDCKNWVITFVSASAEGVAGGVGVSAVNAFSTNEVVESEVGTVTATCTYNGFPNLFNKSAKAATFNEKLTATAQVTINPAPAVVTPPEGPITPTEEPEGPTDVVPPTDNSGLPSTGGPHRWLAIGGALLTLVGAGAVLRSRRVA